MKRQVIAAVDDIFFAAKIRAASEGTNTSVSFGRDLQSIIEAARETKAALIIVDLHATRFDPLALARALKADAQLNAVNLLGFFSHVQTALMQQAKEAGFDRVLPRSAFNSRLPEILEGQSTETLKEKAAGDE